MSAYIHRCGECGHKSLDHLGSIGWGNSGKGAGPRVGFCGYGGCACNLSQGQVEAIYPDVVEVPTFAEADRGRWFA